MKDERKEGWKEREEREMEQGINKEGSNERRRDGRKERRKNKVKKGKKEGN